MYPPRPAVLLVPILAAILHAGCRPCTPAATPSTAPTVQAPAADEFSIMTYNVYRYGYHDRDDDGQRDDFKPADQCEALYQVIHDCSPDILVVQEMGSPSTFSNFVAELRARGTDYAHTILLNRTGWKRTNIGLLSRYPVSGYTPLTNDTYSIGNTNRSVSRGFLQADIQVNPGYTLRIIGAHLKSKMFHELGQTEIRRSEARLLHQHVKASIEENPDVNLLVLGDMNDTQKSKAIRLVRGEETELLEDLRPEDVHGDAWTHCSKWNDVYQRIDYLLVNDGARAELVPSKTVAVRHPDMLTASDHRPLYAVFKAANLPVAGSNRTPSGLVIESDTEDEEASEHHEGSD